jgi:hypothetical protein
MGGLISLLSLFLALQGSGAVPVLSDESTTPPEYRDALCNLAIVRGLNGGRLSVRTGPARRFQRIDMLSDNERIYVCNESRSWWGVVYNRPGSPCRAPERIGLDIRLARRCRSGWVHRDWIEIITG